ncbi:G-type lectin S-receptor-like serine/threonine-protein kinase At4g27290 [Camellia sinensis]|uniref:G-type lectin S-receptor-like serine/threonine-protein kinase At4g27290 n=1 Tax=Camellia sinensis TaxID=4442 RepID=UPI0010358426|nr:G-type lectin S-receptor-like serine/threonine-protein kinase At4g27290 [Camellia sinensis]
MESGNFVVKDANDTSEHFLWQSFDYPCNTLLPGMKLGKNFVKGLERHLSSWKSSDDPTPGNLMHNSKQGHTDKSQTEDLEFPLFDLAVIVNSTNNFSINNKLGEGGFRSVYKGILEGGQEIAVKRLSKNSSQGLDEFKNEVICIAKLQHRNLVKLLGCCIQGEETIGYMSSEYAIDGLFSIKSYVFSFGVLVLEIVSGKKNRGFYHPGHSLNLLRHAWRLYEDGKSLELIDEALWDLCYQTEMLRSIHVGLLCVHDSLEDRPSMSSIVLMLCSEAALP